MKKTREISITPEEEAIIASTPNGYFQVSGEKMVKPRDRSIQIYIAPYHIVFKTSHYGRIIFEVVRTTTAGRAPRWMVIACHDLNVKYARA